MWRFVCEDCGDGTRNHSQHNIPFNVVRSNRIEFHVFLLLFSIPKQIIPVPLARGQTILILCSRGDFWLRGNFRLVFVPRRGGGGAGATAHRNANEATE